MTGRKVPVRIIIPGHPVPFIGRVGLPYSNLTIEQAVAHATNLAETHNTRAIVKLGR